MRLKLEQVLERDGVVPGSHDYKQITSIFDSIPREELFWSDAERLHKDIRTIMGLEQERGVRLTVRPDPLGRGLASPWSLCRVTALTLRCAAIDSKAILYDKLSASHVDYQLAMGEDESQLRFHFFFTTETSHFDVDVPALERDIIELTRTWDDHLLDRLILNHGEVQGRRLAEQYEAALRRSL